MVIVRLASPKIFCCVRMLPPLIMKWLANVCRSTEESCPFGNDKLIRSTASRNAE